VTKKAPAKKSTREEDARALTHEPKSPPLGGGGLFGFSVKSPVTRESARMTNMQSQAQYVLRTVEERGVRFVQLWFTDVLDVTRPFTSRRPELEDALDQGNDL